nr:MAG TPA: hypothetical protein [Caudoviricetes sp.]
MMENQLIHEVSNNILFQENIYYPKALEHIYLSKLKVVSYLYLVGMQIYNNQYHVKSFQRVLDSFL